MRSSYPEGLAHSSVTCQRSAELLGESLFLPAFCLLRTLFALLPVYLTAQYLHLFAATDSKWRVANIITPPVHCIEADGLYASDRKLLHRQAEGGGHG